MPDPSKLKAFLEEVAAVCRKHELILTEDYGGLAVAPNSDERMKELLSTPFAEDLFED